MSGIPYNVTISSDSPTVNYLPFRDGAINEGWNMSCSDCDDSTWMPQTFCLGQSSRRSTFVGASLYVDFYGTGVFLYGNAISGSYVIEMDGQSRDDLITNPSSDLLGKVEGLSNDLHRIYLNITQSNLLSFYEAVVTIDIEQQDSSSILRNQTILPFTTASNGLTTTNPMFTYTGYWYSAGKIGATGNVEYPRQHTSQTGGYVTFQITQASAFFIYGLVNVDLGPFSVTLSPPLDAGQSITNVYNSNAHWINLDRVMYWASGLDRDKTYSIKITNVGQDRTPWWDFSHIDVVDAASSVPSETPSPKNHKTYVGVIVGAAVGVVALATIMMLLISYRRLKRRSKLSTQSQIGDVFQEVDTPFLFDPVGHTTIAVTQSGRTGHIPRLSGQAYEQSGTSLTHSGVVTMSWNGEEWTHHVVREQDAGSISETGDRVVRLPPDYKESWLRGPQQ